MMICPRTDYVFLVRIQPLFLKVSNKAALPRFPKLLEPLFIAFLRGRTPKSPALAAKVTDSFRILQDWTSICLDVVFDMHPTQKVFNLILENYPNCIDEGFLSISHYGRRHYSRLLKQIQKLSHYESVMQTIFLSRKCIGDVERLVSACKTDNLH